MDKQSYKKGSNMIKVFIHQNKRNRDIQDYRGASLYRVEAAYKINATLKVAANEEPHEPKIIG